MKEIFKEFYINEDNLDFQRLDDKTIIVLDTNILLNLYVVSSNLQVQILETLEKVKSNLWMPYQVGYEFHKNRKNKKKQFENQKKKLIKDLSEKMYKVLDEEKSNFENQGFYKARDFLNENQNLFDNLKENITEFTKKLDGNFNQETTSDPITKLNELYKAKVNQIENNDYKSWVDLGKERYKDKIPPGYKDEGKDNNISYNGEMYPAKYGDFFLWKEILEYAKNNSLENVIFVTEDLKEDWFYETQGAKIGPRIELIKELLNVANAKLRIYRTETFMTQVNNLDEKNNMEMLKELRGLREIGFNDKEDVEDKNISIVSEANNKYNYLEFRIRGTFKRIVEIKNKLMNNGYNKVYLDELDNLSYKIINLEETLGVIVENYNEGNISTEIFIDKIDAYSLRLDHIKININSFEIL